ncbi:MAG: arginase family protein [Candidatus Diapherotrites archaeon]
MKLVKVPSSQGSLEKNIGCELAPEILCSKEAESVKVIPNDLETTEENIYSKAKEVIKQKPIFVGGDHSITYSLFKAFSEEFEKPCLLIFDAHADCDVFFKPVSHQDLNRAVIEENLIEKERLLIIGLRKVFDVEKPFFKEHKISIISSEEIHKNFNKAKEQLQKFLGEQKNIYLSIDIDALDPSIAPGTGYREENGLTKQEFFEVLEMVLDSGKVKAADLVEVNPKLDDEGKTIKLGKNIISIIAEKLGE